MITVLVPDLPSIEWTDQPPVKDDQEIAALARLIMFKPWRSPDDLKQGKASWYAALKQFMSHT